MKPLKRSQTSHGRVSLSYRLKTYNAFIIFFLSPKKLDRCKSDQRTLTSSIRVFSEVVEGELIPLSYEDPKKE
jgi:hypothetical protein